MNVLGARVAAVASSAVETRQESESRVAPLTRGLARGDEAAFREFHQLYFDQLYRFLLVLCRGQEHAAQEAVQETLLRVARYAHPFDSEEIFWNWLKVLARSASRDAGRKQSRYLALLERFALVWRTTPVLEPSRENVLQDTVEEALDRLKPEDRHLIQDKYLSGATVKELAWQRGLTEKAVESRLLRVRRQLREYCMSRLNAS